MACCCVKFRGEDPQSKNAGLEEWGRGGSGAAALALLYMAGIWSGPRSIID